MKTIGGKSYLFAVVCVDYPGRFGRLDGAIVGVDDFICQICKTQAANQQRDSGKEFLLG